MRMLVTGGAGFIGANFVHYTLQHRPEPRSRCLDALTYAGNEATSTRVRDRIEFVQGDVADAALVDALVSGTRRRRPLRRRVAQRQLAARPVAVRAHQPRRHVHDPGGGAAARRAAAPHLHRRGVRRPRARRPDEVHPGAPRTTRPARTARPRPDRTCWCGPGCARSASTPRSRTARTTTGRTSTSRSSSRDRSPTCSAGIRPKLYGAGTERARLDPRRRPQRRGVGDPRPRPLRRDLPDRCRRRGGQPHGAGRDPRADGHSPPDWFDHVTDRAGHDLRYAIDATKLREELGWRAALHRLPGRPGQTIDWYAANRAWWEPAKARRRGPLCRGRPVSYGRALAGNGCPRAARQRPGACAGRRRSGGDRPGARGRLRLLDVTDPAAVRAAASDLRRRCVVNAAAYTAVDEAESDEQTATGSTRAGRGLLAAAVARHGGQLMHVSTDYVFAGDARQPYEVDDEPAAAQRVRAHQARRRAGGARASARRVLCRPHRVGVRRQRGELRQDDVAAGARARHGARRGRPAWLADLVGGSRPGPGRVGPLDAAGRGSITAPAATTPPGTASRRRSSPSSARTRRGCCRQPARSTRGRRRARRTRCSRPCLAGSRAQSDAALARCPECSLRRGRRRVPRRLIESSITPRQRGSSPRSARRSAPS